MEIFSACDASEIVNPAKYLSFTSWAFWGHCCSNRVRASSSANSSSLAPSAPKLPSGTETVRTYAEYGQIVEAFFQGNYQLLIVVGQPGLAKSHEFEQRAGRRGHLIKGWTAPLQAYIEAYRHRDQPMVFDDAEVLWKRPGGRILIRSLTEHRTRKLVQWKSTTKDLAKQAVPQSFYTISKVAIVANRFAFGGEEEREAVLDRGHLIYFDPTPVEIHNRIADWFWDQEIYDYLGERLIMLDRPSVRTYIKAWERKQAGGDWKKLIQDVFCHDNATKLVQILEGDAECNNVDDRVGKFIAQSGMSRATYFNLKRKFRDNEQLQAREKLHVPRRILRGTPPEEAEPPPMIRRRPWMNQKSTADLHADSMGCQFGASTRTTQMTTATTLIT